MNEESLQARAETTLFYPLEGGAVVYDEIHRELFGLNASAAYVWLCLKHGLRKNLIENEFAAAFEVSRDAAERSVNEAFQAFAVFTPPVISEHTGKFGIRPFLLNEPPTTTYVHMGRPIRLAAPAEAAAVADKLLTGCKVAETDMPEGPGLEIKIEAAGGGWRITSSIRDTQSLSHQDLIVELEQLIVHFAVFARNRLLAFHAGSSSLGRSSILLTAPSGSGKTTMSATLAANGWQYGSDELTLFEGDAWRNLPLPPCIKHTSYSTIETQWPILREEPEWNRYGRRVKFLPLAVESRELNVTTVVFPRYSPESVTALEYLAPMDGLARLLAGCVYISDDFKRESVEKLLAWHTRTRYVAMSYSDSIVAVGLLGNEIYIR